MVETQGLTEQEQSLIRRESINVTAIDRQGVFRKLTRVGIDPDRARAIIEANEPQFKVYGRGTEGAIAQQSRIEEARKVGLPSTATSQQIASRGGTPQGFSYVTSEGQTYKGTRAFLEQKQQKDIQIQQQKEQARQLPSQQESSVVPELNF